MVFVQCLIKIKVSWEWQPFRGWLSGPIKGLLAEGRLVDTAKPSSAGEGNEAPCMSRAAFALAYLGENSEPVSTTGLRFLCYSRT